MKRTLMIATEPISEPTAPPLSPINNIYWLFVSPMQASYVTYWKAEATNRSLPIPLRG